MSRAVVASFAARSWKFDRGPDRTRRATPRAWHQSRTAWMPTRSQ
ncbi:hypothetical protein [Streptosporangium sp. NPDC003464]